MKQISIVSLTEQLDSQRQKVDVDHFDITLRELHRMVSDEELIRAPSYQRRFRWREEDESRLIESLFLGLPVPSIFVATNKDGTWELVDGLQRISTLVHYTTEASNAELLNTIGKHLPLTLGGLKKLPGLNATNFHSIPTTLQFAFWKRSLRVTALSDKSDIDVRFDLFERLNAGGIALSPQEVRDCIYRGEFADFLQRMADLPSFNRLLKLQSKKQADGTKEELVLKFFAYLTNRNEFDGRVTIFLNNFMRKCGEAFDYFNGEKLFIDTVGHLEKILGGPFKRANVSVSPLVQLEGVMVGLAEIISTGKKPKMVSANELLEDPELVEFSTGGTNTSSMLNGRIERAKRILS